MAEILLQAKALAALLQLQVEVFHSDIKGIFNFYRRI
jgi:hypothetical protein